MRGMLSQNRIKAIGCIIQIMQERQKVVGISNWYLLFRIIWRLGLFLFAFVITWIALYGILGDTAANGQTSLIFSIGIISVLFIGDLLYWKQSGIFVNKGGDHIVRLGGWISKEDKLLNGAIISNQVERGPIDQIFGMASMTIGLFGNRKIKGVKYNEIESYDDMMRDSSDSFTSMF